MTANECIRARRSVRSYADRPVERAQIEALADAARWAPSWKNTQTARWTAAVSPEARERLAGCVMGHAGNAAIIRSAPAVMVLSSVEKRSGYERDGSFTTAKEDRWEVFDAGLAAEAFCLAACEAGLGTVIMGIFDPAAVAEAVSLPDGRRAAALIALGYAADEPAPPKRRAVDEVLSFI